MTRKLKLSLFSLLVMGWLFFIAPDQSFADEVTVQVSPAPSETSTVTIQITAQSSVLSAQTAVSEAQTTLQTVDTQANTLSNPTTVDQAIATAQTSIDAVNQNIQTVIATMTDLGTANNNVSLQQVVVESATASVSQAETAVAQATQEVSTATTQVATDTQALQTANQNLEQAQTNLTNAQTTLTQATTAVDAQIPVVATAQTNKDAAQAVVNANTSPGLTMTVYSNPGTAGSPAMGGNVVYTGTDTNGINEQWGSSGPTVNSGTVTVTETFNNNQLNTNIGITVNGTPVSTINNSGVYIGSIGFPGGSDPSLNLYQPSATTTITMPSGTTSAGFAVFAKNGNTTGTVTYTDGTTETYVLQDDVNANYPNYVHQETFTAPAGKTIATVTIPTDWDYFAVDNVTATKPGTAVVTEDFQVRWQGLWTPQYTGTQYITAPADDGVRLYLDGQLVIDDWVDKGGGGSTADVSTTAGVAKAFDMWYYENGGGANVSLQRYTGSGWEVIPASEFSTSTASATQIANLATATQTLNTEQTTLSTLQQAEITAQNNVASANQTVSNQTLVVQTAQNDLQISNQILQTSQQNLTTANENLTTANQNLTTANQNLTNLQSTAQAAEVSASMAISNLNTSVQVMQTNVSNVQATYSAQAALEEQQRQAAAIAIAEAQAKAAAEAAAKAEADAKAAAEAAAKTEAEAKAAAEAAAKAEADAKAAAEAAAKAEAEAKAAAEAAAKAEAEKLAAEAEAAAKVAEEKAAAEAAAKAEAEKAAAEAQAKAAEQAAAEKAAQDAQAKADAAKAEAEKAAAEKAAEENKIAETIGVKPNSPDQLSDTVVKEAPKEVLIAHIQVDKTGVENGGIEFFGTKSQPQVVGEDGKLTPPPPPPGSGLPIPPDAITTTETFIGQPGGTTFNAPDIAVPVIIKPVCVTIKDETGKEIHVDTDGNEHPIEACTFLPAALDAIPGAAVAMEALNAIYGDMANLGNDMSPVTRKKAKKILLATIVVGQIAAFRRRFGE